MAKGQAATTGDTIVGPMTNHDLRTITIPVDASYSIYVANASARFGYLRPNVKLEAHEQCVVIQLAASDDEIAAVTQDFRFCLYREKIYRETLPLRQTLIQGVMGR